jgi:gas vesicle protein
MELNIMLPKGIGTFTKGIATGMVLGAAVSMITKPANNRKRSNLKRNATKTLRAVGDLIQNAQYMMK